MQLLVFAMSVLSGEGAGLTLNWSASEACPSSAQVLTHVDQFLREGGATGDAVTADAHIVESLTGYELSLVLRASSGDEHHELWSQDCEELSWVGALLIAGFIDPIGVQGLTSDAAQYQWVEAQARKYEPVAVQRPNSPPPLQRPTRVGPMPPGRQATSESGVPADQRERVTVDRLRGLVSGLPIESRRGPLSVLGMAFLGLGGHFGLFPGAGANGHLGVAVELGRVRLLARGQAWVGPGLEGSVESAGVELGLRLSAWSAGGGVCGLPGWRTLYFPICLQAHGGQFGATGGSSTQRGQWSTDESQPWAAVALQTGVEWWLVPPLGLYANIGGAASLLLPVFSLGSKQIDGQITTIEEFNVSVPYIYIHLGTAFRFGRGFLRNGSRFGGQRN